MKYFVKKEEADQELDMENNFSCVTVCLKLQKYIFTYSHLNI